MDRRLLCTLLVLAAVMLVEAADEEACECVPYFQCIDGKIVTDGEGLLDVRIKTCTGVDVCCQIPTDVPERTNPESVDQVSPDPEPVEQEPNLEPSDPELLSSTPTSPTNPRPIPPRLNNATKYTLPTILGTPGCGRRRVGLLPSRIFDDGNLADTFYGEAPWMVLIMNKNTFVCAGTLIKPTIVLTAAHCIPETGSIDMTIRVGEYNTSSTDEPFNHIDKNVKLIIPHPEFNEKNLANDIALIELDSPATENEIVDVICMPSEGDPVDDKACIAYGWGVSDKSSSTPIQDTMKKVDLPVITKDECQNKLRITRLGKYFSLLPGFLCAGGTTGKDTCKGDGGGPLICPLRKDSTRLVQVGIVSWGIECGKGNPTVFASVHHYLPWIRQQIA